MEVYTKFVNGNNQIAYESLRDLVASCSISEFIEQLPRPFLIAKKLYDGKLKPKIGGSFSETTTMKFNMTASRSLSDTAQGACAEKNEEEYGSQLIYVLRQKSLQNAVSGTIRIGRNGTNDIVLGDSVVSAKHALIRFRNDSFFIEDLNSTNGTRINGVRIPGETELALPLNATVDFGRLSFVFAHPLYIYRLIRKDIIG